MKRLLTFVFILFLTATPAKADMITQELKYKDGDTELTGRLIYSDTLKTPAPGVLVTPEWWGITDYTISRGLQIAALGYVALVVDVYGDNQTADNPEDAQKLATPFYQNPALFRGRMQAALDALKAQPQVDPARIGAIGYCFGGTGVLELARTGADVKGVVSFHGGLKTSKPAVPGTIKAQVLALNGADDPMSPPSDRDAFTKEMTAAGVTFKSVDYPGAIHAFTNPGATEKGEKFNLPIAYNEDADKMSSDEMKTFFQRLFKQ